mgnify:FL=1|jgi:hypothetical protein
MKDNLNCNGYIIQRNEVSYYKGIEGDNWYLNYCSDNNFFEDYYSKEIDKAWENIDYIDCCTNMEYIHRYIEESKKMCIPIRLLLCYTSKKFPVLNDECIKGKKIFLGYDYADSGGSYYSSVLNDVISKRIPEFKNISLNKNGLFDSYDEIMEYLKARRMLADKKKYDFDAGDFIVYRVEEIIL